MITLNCHQSELDALLISLGWYMSLATSNRKYEFYLYSRKSGKIVGQWSALTGNGFLELSNSGVD